MSEKGWQDFLAADGLQDWAVLHGGATAFFRTNSIKAAAKLTSEIAELPFVLGPTIRLTASEDGVSVRLTRDVWQIESEHIGMAKAISITAREHGAVPDRSALQEVQFAIAAKADMIDVGFWRAVLGYSLAADDNAIDPLGHGSTVWMQEINSSKPLCHAMHIDVSLPREQVQERLAMALAAGGRVVDDSHAPSHWTLADRAGNRVCIAGWPDGLTLAPK